MSLIVNLNFQYLRDALLVKDDPTFKSSKKVENPPEVSLVHVATVRSFINQNSHSFFEHKVCFYFCFIFRLEVAVFLIFHTVCIHDFFVLISKTKQSILCALRYKIFRKLIKNLPFAT